MNTSLSVGDLIQTVVTLLTVVGLIVTVEFNARSLRAQRDALRAQREESVTMAFLSLNQQLQGILYRLLEDEPNILKTTDIDILKPFQFKFFQMIDVFADIYQLRDMIRESDAKLWERTEARVRQLAQKPAVRALWSKQVAKNPEVFSQVFINEMTVLTSPGTNNEVADYHQTAELQSKSNKYPQ